jgi:hypothetical protein
MRDSKTGVSQLSYFIGSGNTAFAEQYDKEQTPIIPVFCEGEHLDSFVGYYSFDSRKFSPGRMREYYFRGE